MSTILMDEEVKHIINFNRGNNYFAAAIHARKEMENILRNKIARKAGELAITLMSRRYHNYTLDHYALAAAEGHLDLVDNPAYFWSMLADALFIVFNDGLLKDAATEFSEKVVLKSPVHISLFTEYGTRFHQYSTHHAKLQEECKEYIKQRVRDLVPQTPHREAVLSAFDRLDLDSHCYYPSIMCQFFAVDDFPYHWTPFYQLSLTMLCAVSGRENNSVTEVFINMLPYALSFMYKYGSYNRTTLVLHTRLASNSLTVFNDCRFRIISKVKSTVCRPKVYIPEELTDEELSSLCFDRLCPDFEDYIYASKTTLSRLRTMFSKLNTNYLNSLLEQLEEPKPRATKDANA